MDPSAAVTEEGPPDVEPEVSDGLTAAEVFVVVALVEVEDWEVVLDDADVANVVVVSAGDETALAEPPSPMDVTTLGQFFWIVASPGPDWIGLHPGRALM